MNETVYRCLSVQQKQNTPYIYKSTFLKLLIHFYRHKEFFTVNQII